MSHQNKFHQLDNRQILLYHQLHNTLFDPPDKMDLLLYCDTHLFVLALTYNIQDGNIHLFHIGYHFHIPELYYCLDKLLVQVAHKSYRQYTQTYQTT